MTGSLLDVVAVAITAMWAGLVLLDDWLRARRRERRAPTPPPGRKPPAGGPYRTPGDGPSVEEIRARERVPEGVGVRPDGTVRGDTRSIFGNVAQTILLLKVETDRNRAELARLRGSTEAILRDEDDRTP